MNNNKIRQSIFFAMILYVGSIDHAYCAFENKLERDNACELTNKTDQGDMAEIIKNIQLLIKNKDFAAAGALLEKQDIQKYITSNLDEEHWLRQLVEFVTVSRQILNSDLAKQILGGNIEYSFEEVLKGPNFALKIFTLLGAPICLLSCFHQGENGLEFDIFKGPGTFFKIIMLGSFPLLLLTGFRTKQ